MRRLSYFLIILFSSGILFLVYINHFRQVSDKTSPNQLADMQNMILDYSLMHESEIFKYDSIYSYSGATCSKFFASCPSRLGLWYAPWHCKPCIISALNILNSVSNDTQNSQPIVLTTHNSLREFKVSISNHDLKESTYYIPGENIHPGLKEISKPCFFVIDSLGVCRYLHFFDTDQTELNNTYFAFIYEYFIPKQSKHADNIP